MGLLLTLTCIEFPLPFSSEKFQEKKRLFYVTPGLPLWFEQYEDLFDKECTAKTAVRYGQTIFHVKESMQEIETMMYRSGVR